MAKKVTNVQTEETVETVEETTENVIDEESVENETQKEEVAVVEKKSFKTRITEFKEAHPRLTTALNIGTGVVIGAGVLVLKAALSNNKNSDGEVVYDDYSSDYDTSDAIAAEYTDYTETSYDNDSEPVVSEE